LPYNKHLINRAKSVCMGDSPWARAGSRYHSGEENVSDI